MFSDFSAKMRVQAKKIDPLKDNYDSIAHANKYGLQIEKLIQDANDKNFIPLYAFYSSLEEHLMCKQRINKSEGVFMAGANLVYSEFIEKQKKPILPPDVMSKCVPLSCFLCCPLNHGDDNPDSDDPTSKNEGFIRFLEHYYSSEITSRGEEESNSNENKFRGIYTKIPNYVSSLLQHASEGISVRCEEEFSKSIEGVNSILIYDARNR